MKVHPYSDHYDYNHYNCCCCCCGCGDAFFFLQSYHHSFYFLQLNKVLSAQHVISESVGKPVHDEHLFIITHQGQTFFVNVFVYLSVCLFASVSWFVGLAVLFTDSPQSHIFNVWMQAICSLADRISRCKLMEPRSGKRMFNELL